MIGLSEQYLDGPSAVELRGRLHADIGAATAFDAVIAREFIDAEQVAGIVYQALGVFVGKLARIGFIGTNDDLRDRLDSRGPPRLNVDEGIAIFKADRRHHAQRLGVAHGEEVRNARLVRDRGIDRIRADARKRRPDFTGGIGERPPPLRLSRKPRVRSGDAAKQALRRQPRERIGGRRHAEAIGVSERRDRVERGGTPRQAGEIGLVAEFSAKDRMVENVRIIDHRVDNGHLLLETRKAEIVDRARIKVAAIADAGQIKLGNGFGRQAQK